MEKKRICNNNCCVFGCHSKKGRERHLSFHLFPKRNSSFVYLTNAFGIKEKVERRKAWEMKLLMGKPTTSFMHVCSLHFKREDYILSEYGATKPRLKPNAIPSENLPSKSCISVKAKCRPRRYRRDLVDRITNIAPEEVLPSYSKAEQVAIDGLLQLMDVEVTTNEIVTNNTAEKGTQVKSGDIVVPFIASITTDAKLCSVTGLHSFHLLELLVNLVDEYFPVIRQGKLTVKEKIFMVFMKMKTGLRYVVLAALFGNITGKTCKTIFYDTVSKLAFVLKPLIVWPSSEECRKNLPKCFEKFPDVRVILDCTEMAIQKPKRLCCQVMTYSHYKGSQTVKFMTGVSPGGLITFVSDAYGGRASDNAIFEQSDLIRMLEMGKDAVMVDKGFRIENTTDAYHVKLYRPSFLKKKDQFSEEEAIRNIEVSKARVHVERCIQRIKVFEIFLKPLPITLLPIINDIFIIACAFVNMSNPVLNNDKYV